MRKALLLATALLIPAVTATRRHRHLVERRESHARSTGTGTAVQNPPADTASIIDLKSYPPKILATVDVPAAVAVRPQAVAISADESWASSPPPRSWMAAARGRQQGLGHRPEGQPTQGGANAGCRRGVPPWCASPGRKTRPRRQSRRRHRLRLHREGQAPGSGRHGGYRQPEIRPSGIVILPDGKRALLTRDGDHHDQPAAHPTGTEVKIDPRRSPPASHPTPMDITRPARSSPWQHGPWQWRLRHGAADRPEDTHSASCSHRRAALARRREVLARMRRFLAIGSQNGSNKAEGFPFRSAQGLLNDVCVDGINLRKDRAIAHRRLAAGLRLLARRSHAARAKHDRACA